MEFAILFGFLGLFFIIIMFVGLILNFIKILLEVSAFKNSVMKKNLFLCYLIYLLLLMQF